MRNAYNIIVPNPNRKRAFSDERTLSIIIYTCSRIRVLLMEWTQSVWLRIESSVELL
jgi:hypothetical protein